MKFLPSNRCGHVIIEVDLEISDNSTRDHRCCFYVEGELGMIERLGHELCILSEGGLGDIAALDALN